MATITRRKNESLLRRIWRNFKPSLSASDVLSGEGFRMELAREISRSNRRRQDREFAVVHLVANKPDAQFTPTSSMIGDFRSRLRISDCLGWHCSHLSALLPETDREGAFLVANELGQIAKRHGKAFETRVYIYPWDDELLAVSNEIASDSEIPTEFNRSQFSDDSTNGFTNGSANGRLLSESEDYFSGPEQGSNGNGGVNAMLTFETSVDGANATTGLLAVAGRPATLPTNHAVDARPAASVVKTTHPKTRLAESVATPWSKRVVDIAGAGLGLVLLSPLLLAAAVAVKLSSSGPIFFRQAREGKDGKSFMILKFRTMVTDAEALQDSLREHSEQDGPAFKIKDDPRVTLVGKYLRKSCMDELPQLVNVLLGQMSLVGPRPLPLRESHHCSPWQRQRLTVLPGLTCTWQVRGGRKVTFEQWMRMDLDYIQKRSLAFDLRLIAETAMRVLLHRGSV